MARILKEFDRSKGLPFWYVDFDGDRYGPFSTRKEAFAYLDNDDADCSDKRHPPSPPADSEGKL